MLLPSAFAEVFDLRTNGNGPFRLAILGTHTGGTENDRPSILLGASSHNPRSDQFEILVDLGSPASGCLEFKRKNRLSVQDYPWSIKAGLIRSMVENCAHMLITDTTMERLSGLNSSIALENLNNSGSFSPSLVLTTSRQLQNLKPLFAASEKSLNIMEKQVSSTENFPIHGWKGIVLQPLKPVKISESWEVQPIMDNERSPGWFLKSSPQKGWILFTGPNRVSEILRTLFSMAEPFGKMATETPSIMVVEVKYPNSMNRKARETAVLTPDLLIVSLAGILLDTQFEKNWIPGNSSRQYLAGLSSKVAARLSKCTIVITGREARHSEIIARELSLYSRMGMSIVIPDQGDLILR
jgi:hypothetical protein